MALSQCDLRLGLFDALTSSCRWLSTKHWQTQNTFNETFANGYEQSMRNEIPAFLSQSQDAWQRDERKQKRSTRTKKFRRCLATAGDAETKTKIAEFYSRLELRNTLSDDATRHVQKGHTHPDGKWQNWGFDDFWGLWKRFRGFVGQSIPKKNSFKIINRFLRSLPMKSLVSAP